MLLLIVNWEDAGVLKVLNVANEEAIPQDLLQLVNHNVCDVFRVETTARGGLVEQQFRRMLVETEEPTEQEQEEAEDAGEDPVEKLKVADWELVNDHYVS